MKSVRLLAVEANDWLWERSLGIATTGAECQPTAYHVMRKLFEACPLGEDDHFIDIGCGRGRALCYAALRPVARVAGVEFRVQHAASAQRNLGNLRGRKALDWHVMGGSAADFDLSGGTVYYMYNPFSGPLFEDVVGRMRAVAKTASKPIRLLYLNPQHRDVIERDGWMRKPECVHYDRAGNEAVLLYTSH
jgi:SAM-dependent methyltransferase